MNSRLFTVLVVSGLLAGLGVAPAFAQVSGQAKADIPFEFVVAGKTMPAGEYIVDSRIASSLATIRNEDTRDTAFVLTNSVETLNYSDEGKLVFHRYGNQYFLAQIWAPGSTTGRELPKSKAEREVSRTASLERQNVILLAMR